MPLWRFFFDYDKKNHELKELEEKTLDPNFWTDSKKAEAVLKEVKSRKSWVSTYDKLTAGLEDLDTMYEFFKSGDATEADAEELYQAALKILKTFPVSTRRKNAPHCFNDKATNAIRK